MREMHRFSSVFERLTMVLILTQDGTKLQFKFALMVNSPISLADALTLVEFRITDQCNALF